MIGAMRHRGPDDQGEVSANSVTLGMCRLAIIDPTNGHQPMTTKDGRFHLVFNGCIYNHNELRKDYASRGYSFGSQCDTEVLVAAYAMDGEACLKRFRGMFSFAVWDAQTESLFLARDPLGIKPLYYHQRGRSLVFASELKALLASRLAPTSFDQRGVSDYLAYLAVPAPRTIYRDVFSLRPGECARFEQDVLTVRKYWTFPRPGSNVSVCRSAAEFTEGLKAQLHDTVRAHLVSDVPIGAFLSGGLDSTAVVGLMAKAGAHPLRTFSIAFKEAAWSEAAPARISAQYFGTEHHEKILTGQEVAGDLESLLSTYDQPTGDGVNTYYVSKAAHEGGVKVALSGLGGDELFGGYPSFRDLPKLNRASSYWRSWPSAARSGLAAALRVGGTQGRKLGDFIKHANNLHELNSLQRRVFPEAVRRSLLGDAKSAGPHHPELDTLTVELAGTDDFQTISGWELRTYMADVLLRDSDVMSMRHSLELRVPFVDRPLLEWLWLQPTQFKYKPGAVKRALANAVSDVLPPDLLNRRKMGFTLPFSVWMRNELRPFLDYTFSHSTVGKTGLIDPAEANACWEKFKNGSDNRAWSRVWSLAVLIDFVNRRRA